MRACRVRGTPTQLPGTFGLEDVEDVGCGNAHSGAMSGQKCLVARVLLPEPIGLAPADLVELDAVANDVAVRELELVGRIQHLRFEELQLERDRQTLGGPPRPDPEEHFTGFEECQGDQVLQAVKIGSSVCVAFFDPMPPEVWRPSRWSGTSSIEEGLQDDCTTLPFLDNQGSCTGKTTAGPMRDQSQIPAAPLLYVPSHPGRSFDQDLEAAGIAKRTGNGKLDFHAARTAYLNLVFEDRDITLTDAQKLARHSTAKMTLEVYGRARE